MRGDSGFWILQQVLATTRAIASLITWLFYLTSRHLGSQLVIRARALDGKAAR